MPPRSEKHSSAEMSKIDNRANGQTDLSIETDRQTDRQTDSQSDRQTVRQTNYKRETDRILSSL